MDDAEYLRNIAAGYAREESTVHAFRLNQIADKIEALERWKDGSFLDFWRGKRKSQGVSDE